MIDIPHSKWVFLLLVVLVAPVGIRAADTEKTAEETITPAARKAIDQGLQWLASRQNNDGSFGIGSLRGNAGICGLCGMSFMSAGSTPDRGLYGEHVARAIDYLLANAQPSGFIVEPTPNTQGPMYSHGFATLFLAECHGMSKRTDLRDKLSLAVKLIVHSQNKEGGWRYQPVKSDADISVTVCQVMALRAAHNAGIQVEQKVVDDAVEYVKKCQNRDGGFCYMLSAGGGPSEFPRSAAAIVALYGAGKQEDEKAKITITRGLDYLAQFRPEQHMQYYEYGHYYAVQAMWQTRGARWARWYPAIREELIARQKPDGSWAGAYYGAECATAMCLMVLQMPDNQLPIFQR